MPEERRHARPEPGGLGVRHRGEAPDDDHEREPEAGAEPIHHPAGDEQADRIGELEGKDDVGVVDLGPAELTLQRRLEDADDLPVDVVDGRRGEQQTADIPAPVAKPHTDGRSGRRRPAFGNRDRRGRHWTLQMRAALAPLRAVLEPVASLVARTWRHIHSGVHPLIQ